MFSSRAVLLVTGGPKVMLFTVVNSRVLLHRKESSWPWFVGAAKNSLGVRRVLLGVMHPHRVVLGFIEF